MSRKNDKGVSEDDEEEDEEEEDEEDEDEDEARSVKPRLQMNLGLKNRKNSFFYLHHKTWSRPSTRWSSSGSTSSLFWVVWVLGG